MNIILIEISDFISPDTILLKERRALHIINVLRAKIGDKLRVGIVNKQQGEAIVTKLSKSEVELAINLNNSAPPPLPVTLLLALPRPKVLKRVLGTAVTMGVKNIFLFNSWRVDKSYWQTPLLESEKIKEICLSALEQAVDTILPKIILKPRFRPFAEDEVPILAKNRNAWLLHPYSNPATTSATTKSATQKRDSALIAIGPEGGFIPFEVEMLIAAGLIPVTYGPRILRVEQAVPCALAQFLTKS